MKMPLYLRLIMASVLSKTEEIKAWCFCVQPKALAQWEDGGPLVPCTVPNAINVSVAAVTCCHVKITPILCINFAKCLFLLAWTVTICYCGLLWDISLSSSTLPNLHVIAFVCSVQTACEDKVRFYFLTWTICSFRLNSVLSYIWWDQG